MDDQRERRLSVLSDFSCTKAMPGRGSRLIFLFLKDFQDEFCTRIKKYATHCEEDGELDHLFCYGEQRSKTHMTAALDAVCDCHFLQET